jgi:hypothetical protein
MIFFAKLQTFAIRVYQQFLAAIERNTGSNPINNSDLEPDLFAEKIFESNARLLGPAPQKAQIMCREFI